MNVPDGRAAPVILLHCSGSSGSQWDALAGRLSPRHEVFAPDYQDRADILSPRRGLREDAAAVRRLVGPLELPAHLVGHSYGGAVALRLACDWPGEYLSLTLVEPTAFQLLRGGGERDLAALDEIGQVARYLRQALNAGRLMSGFGYFVDYWNAQGAWEAMPAPRRDRFAPLLGRVVGDFRALLEDAPLPGEIAAIGLPTLIVQGSRSRLPAERVCARLREWIAGAEFEIVEGAGHMLPVTHREALNALVERRLRALGSPSRPEAASPGAAVASCRTSVASCGGPASS